MSGIYAILNLINGMYYIGQTYDLYQRWHTHKHYLNNSTHFNQYLQRAWLKYEARNFLFVVIEYCELDNLTIREQHWIDELKAANCNYGYNLSPTAGSQLGIKRSSETKTKMSAWQIGRKLSDQHKLDISNKLKGKKLSAEVRLNMRNRKGRQTRLFLCVDGWSCKCDKCKEDRKQYYREYARKIRNVNQSSTTT